MRKLVSLLALAGLTGVVHAQGLKAQLESDMAKISAALAKKDLAAFEKLTRPHCTADYKHIENGKAMNYDEMLKTMKQGMGMMTKMRKVQTKMLTFKQNGNKAVATFAHEMVGELPPGEDKKVHVMGFKGVSQNSYRKEGGKWKMSEMKWNSQTMMMDGKPMGAPSGGGK